MKKILMFLLLIVFLSSCHKQESNKKDDVIEASKVKAVWWWDDELSFDYLSFASDNGINTIYYCTSKFNDETSSFIKKANDLNIDVYLLNGDATWLDNNTGLNELIMNFEEYQDTYDNTFKGIHLDIEPHQLNDFNDRRNELILKLINISKTLSQKEYLVEFDIPFWLDDIIEIEDVKKEAYKWMIDYSDSVTIMSYRDERDTILDVASDEYLYASSINKSIIVSVETYSEEGDFVSFYEEGKDYMEGIVDDIYKSAIEGVGGIAIHHIKRWYEMD